MGSGLSGYEMWFDPARNNNFEELEKLLAGGQDIDEPDEDGWTALMLAAYYSADDAMHYLLFSGAETGYECDGETYEHVASRWCRPAIDHFRTLPWGTFDGLVEYWRTFLGAPVQYTDSFFEEVLWPAWIIMPEEKRLSFLEQ